MLHLIIPVKDSISTSIDTLRAIAAAQMPSEADVCVYDDFSEPQNAARLDEECRQLGFRIVHLRDVTDHPSPNYLLVLQTARREALADGQTLGLCIVESDVTVQTSTLSTLLRVADERKDAGLVAAATVDASGAFNYPYLFAAKMQDAVTPTRKHLSFCCTLLTPELLRRVDFDTLNSAKNWFDVTISHASTAAGLVNYCVRTACPLHRPHASRPWKELKYKNPWLYYWRKWTKGFDKI